MSTPWHTDQWFTSPWNFVPEVREGLQFADKIEIHDITLRDGEQQAGLAFTIDEKLKIAEMLAQAGVHRIEAGMVAVSRQDREAVERIVKLGLPAKIFAFSRCMVADVEQAAETGVQGIVVEIPASEHIIEHAYGWPLERAIELSISATARAHELGLYTVFFPIDASRADMSWFLNLIERVAREGHMDALACVDTFGGCSPHAIPYFVREAKRKLPGKPIEMHLHDDFGMAVAGTIAGLAAGADVAHVTVSGIGERAGNAALEETVMALKTMYDVDCGIDTTRFCELSRMVQEACGYKMPPNRAIVGERLFNIESGIVTAWAQACRDDHWLELFPYRWEMVGQKPPDVVLGKHSGAPSITEWRQKLGMTGSLDRDAIMERLRKVKDAALAKKGLLSEEEARPLIE